MSILNLREGVRINLTALRMEDGMSSEDAEAWVTSNLDAACELALGMISATKDKVQGLEDAFEFLRTWMP